MSTAVQQKFENILREEGMPANLVDTEGECLDDFIARGELSLQAVLEDLDITMEDLADAVSQDPEGFQRWFRSTTGHKPH